ncbi:asparaginase [Candidatus Francisella endociliophora]|uniref:Asparaginase n=1 Tax=Candidatus Francisella endociliophora TaxID=653937 RepID=A0A097EN32_9GAMM|nr:isoaspartyl peptidase/L-asparaginase [Francisella sp. FSC1006]AIT08970.1 asparaginase [Francisella sp. FSC1006]
MQKIIIHGGCGAREDKNTSFVDYHNHLIPIIQKSYEYLKKVDDANEAAIYAAKLLEDDEIFNAGTGSRVQQDGQIRMSASIIDSEKQKFAGVINIQNIKNPIEVANRLMQQHHSILGGEQATTFAHDIMGLPKYNPMTEKRYQEYLELKKGYTGTIGVVALDSKGKICAVTSTGGAGFEYPGRVGDSPTVAGNFANEAMGISCTGIGEHIVNQAVAAKIATRVKDGMPLDKAVNKSIAESDDLGDYVGLIAIDKQGNICSGSTSIAQTLYAYADNQGSKTFFEEKIL